MSPRLDLFAVQAHVSAATYRSERAFGDAMARLVDRCSALRAPGVPALAVFPENVATFLALAPLGRLGRFMPSVSAATALSVLVRPLAFARALGRARPRRPEIAALLAVGPEVTRAYERTFAGLALQSQMTIVAGSALLPGEDGRVYNTSMTFGPDGWLEARTRKVNLVWNVEDVLGLSAGRADELEIATTPAGRVGTLVCYDGFAVPHTAHEPGFRAVGAALAERGAEVIANPAANPWPWDGPWVHRAAGASTLRREQWAAEGMRSQLAAMVGARYAVTAHLVGAILDQRFDGRSEILRREPDGRVVTVAQAQRVDSEEIVHARVERAPELAS